MSIPEVSVVAASRVRADLYVFALPSGEPELGAAPVRLRRAAESLRFAGGEDEIAESPVGAAGRETLSLRGLGKPNQIESRGLRSWLRGLVRSVNRRGARSLALFLPSHPVTEGEAAAERIGLELALATYRYGRFKSKSKTGSLRSIQLVAPAGEERRYRRAVERVEPLAGAIALARDLANSPANLATPRWMAAQARQLARTHGMQILVLGRDELKRRKMGGILAVGGGSANPPCLVRLKLGSRGPKVALVGKGVTFDTGGISIKPAADMDEMKFDKCGACAVLATAVAVAELELPVRLSVYLPLVENMPDAAAYRPGDILRCSNGTTVEIGNTDAEGRLILADALAWASRDSPDHMVELSTLTGAAVVALGESAAALYTPDDGLAQSLLAAADEAGERLWRMPLWPEYIEQMRGHHADLKNSGGRWGGANTAAAFLSQFVGGCERWAHVDIAGPAIAKEESGGKGASGYGVATLVRWLRSLS